MSKKYKIKYRGLQDIIPENLNYDDYGMSVKYKNDNGNTIQSPFKEKPKPKPKPKQKESEKQAKEFNYYASMVDPDTGKPYIIPMLSMDDPEYLSKYVEFMKLKEEHPSMFQKILNWE